MVGDDILAQDLGQVQGMVSINTEAFGANRRGQSASCIDIHHREELFLNIKIERQGEFAQAATTGQSDLGFQFSIDQYSLVSAQEMH